VLQAIGATSTVVFRSVVTEGVIIAVLSWLIAAALAWPITAAVGYVAGMVFVKAPLEIVVSPAGLLIWLVIAVVLGAASSLYPAWSASRLTVRQILSYQ
jgi:putative ABC transport system permease protein